MGSVSFSSLFLMRREGLSPFLTSYDLLKSLAIVLVVVDHIGMFFFPENDWFRAVGRGCVPIWCFLIGYSRTRDLSAPLWIWSVLLLVLSFITGGGIFPLTILVTFILIRLVLDPVARVVFKDWESLLYSAFLLGVLTFPTMFFSDYGAVALLMALSGYALRNRENIRIRWFTLRVFMGFTVFFFVVMELVIFNFSPVQAKLAIVLIGSAALLAYFFKPAELPGLTYRLPAFLVSFLQFAGRRTLEIYGAHLVIFKIVAASLAVSHHGWWDDWFWIFPPVSPSGPVSVISAP